MKILIFGANGKVGSLVVKQCLANGHTVSAFIHGNNRLETNPNLRIIQGDIYDSAIVAQAVIGHDVVISCLGSWGTPNKDILSKGMRNIIPAMQSAGVRRIVSLTGADASAPGDHNNVLRRINHWVLSKIAPKILKDGEDHIRLLSGSSLDWTVVRSPVMNNRGSASFYLGNKRPMPWQTINRDAVAAAIYAAGTSVEFIKSAPYCIRR